MPVSLWVHLSVDVKSTGPSKLAIASILVFDPNIPQRGHPLVVGRVEAGDAHVELGTHRGTSSKSGMHGNRSEVLHNVDRHLTEKLDLRKRGCQT